MALRLAGRLLAMATQAALTAKLASKPVDLTLLWSLAAEEHSCFRSAMRGLESERGTVTRG